MYQQAWQEITSDQWILDVISNCYAPEFSGSWPPLLRECLHVESVFPSTQMTLQQEIDSLLAKRVIKGVCSLEFLAFYFHVFLVPKKEGEASSSHQTLSTEPFPPLSPFPNRDSDEHHFSHSTRQLGYVPGSDRHIKVSMCQWPHGFESICTL